MPVSDEILIRPSSKARIDALRDLPFMGQNYLQDRPLLCAIRQRINVLVSRKRFFGDVVDLAEPTRSGRGFAIDALLSPVFRIREISTGIPGTEEIVVDM